MKPIEFVCTRTIELTGEEVAAKILDVENWHDFSGYGPLPGIERAHFDPRTDDVVGTRIHVTNRDGSGHVEEILEWHPAHRIVMRISDFTPPLSRLATEILETWAFQPAGDRTAVSRTFALTPKSPLTRPFCWLISKLLRRAIDRHLDVIEQTARAETPVA